MNPTILCNAISFGYGPASKLMDIASNLPKEWKKELVGTGHSLDLSGGIGFTAVHKVERMEDLAKIISPGKYDASLCVLNPDFVRFSIESSIPVVYVDSLFWMWNSLESCLLDTKYYFVQNFPGVGEQIARLVGNKGNLIEVGPLINPLLVGHRFKKKEGINSGRSYFLVHLGGIESPNANVGEDTQYPFFVTECIIKALQNSPMKDSKLIFAGSKKIMGKLQKMRPQKNVSFGCFSRTEFLELLKGTDAVLTSPGLTATYEFLGYGSPIFFLPPQNYSQWFILTKLRREIPGLPSFHWADFYDADIQEFVDEELGVALVLNIVKRAEKESKAQGVLQEKIAEFFSSYGNYDNALADQFVEKMGGNGVLKIAGVLKEWLG